MHKNPEMLGSGAVGATLAMHLQVRCTGVRVRAGWKVVVPRVCSGAVGRARSGAGVNIISCCITIPVVPAWQA